MGQGLAWREAWGIGQPRTLGFSEDRAGPGQWQIGSSGAGVGGGDTPESGCESALPFGQVNGRRGAVPRRTSQPAPGPQQHQALGVLWAQDRGWLGAAWELVLPYLHLPTEQQRARHPVQ